MERTEGNEDDHPDANMNFAATIPVLEDGTSGVDVVGSDDEILHKIVVSEGESDGGVHETGGITGEATLVRNVGRHFTKRNHDHVANKPDEAVPKEDTERTTPAEAGLGSGRGLGSWRDTHRTSAVPDPMMRPVPTAPPREIMDI